MQTQVTLLNVKPSAALSRRIREKAESLERYHPRILHCRVSVAQEEKRTAHARPYSVTVRVGIPGGELVASHEHHVDPFLAVRDAFAAMRRQLQETRAESRAMTPS